MTFLRISTQDGKVDWTRIFLSYRPILLLWQKIKSKVIWSPKTFFSSNLLKSAETSTHLPAERELQVLKKCVPFSSRCELSSPSCRTEGALLT